MILIQKILLIGSVSLALALLPASFAINQATVGHEMPPMSTMPGMHDMTSMHDMTDMPGMSSNSHSNFSTIKNIHSGLWSDATIWQNGRLPSELDNVTISEGTIVTYDVRNSPVLGEITVKGKLDFTRMKSTILSFGNMTIGRTGYVEIGTTENPMPATIKTIIQLASIKEGGAGIDVMGHLEIHGAPIGNTFAKLVKSAENGTSILTVANKLSWNPGDHVVITSTSLNTTETEENFVASIYGYQITLADPLQNSHDGLKPAQGEVADLTRNVVVTSFNPDVHAMGVMFMKGSIGGISYTEFSHLGGLGVLGKYPIHFHHVQNTMSATVVEGVSVWDSHNRFITIHNSDNITVRNSVGYNSTGHGFFLEDGTEENNTLANNIAILTHPGTLRPDDGSAAGFWIQNPMNRVIGNIAVSASGSGFDFSIPGNAPEVIPLDKKNLIESISQQTTPTVLAISSFNGNEAHSNAGGGLHLYRLDQGNSTSFNVFSNMKMWRNNGVGIDITASPSMITLSTIFGNQQGNMQVETNNMTISKVTVLGELPGVRAQLNTPYNGTARYVVSPFGIAFNAQNITIQDSTFSGHLVKGTMGSADLINRSTGSDKLTMEITNSQLMSKNKIIFGYPMNGDSYIKVDNEHNQPSGFVLYRYDTNHEIPCNVDLAYMAVKCPLTNP
ncbi:MAG TPA: G8 domain-containing protein [Nitrosopumilaceae archaeon]|nr:G8 domain-containing protein [Nitrosopumilaceae archaeon]